MVDSQLAVTSPRDPRWTPPTTTEQAISMMARIICSGWSGDDGLEAAAIQYDAGDQHDGTHHLHGIQVELEVDDRELLRIVATQAISVVGRRRGMLSATPSPPCKCLHSLPW